MPMPGDSESEDNAVGPDITLVVLMADEAVPVVPQGASWDHVCPGVQCVPVVDAVWNPEPVPRPPGSLSSIPLCDSARLERTGVLLA